ncbi:hypothetical protein [Burkholderia vietnamiensis]|uniref:hypothetical protein n=1 Tax=Burkholderia vietnamiensis TaxID=60552 RepID=UPI00158CE3B7|nr:hypothetical protein [Burkholderia vietnamiensis]
MTVKELIEALQDLPMDADVYIPHTGIRGKVANVVTFEDVYKAVWIEGDNQDVAR